MKVLLVITHHIPGSDRLVSSDYINYYCGLTRTTAQLDVFDYPAALATLGRTEMNASLLRRVRQTKPDVVFVVLNSDEFIPATMDEIKSLAITLGFFHDDIWRREYARRWAQHFSHILLTDPFGDRKLRSLGVDNAIVFPQACNHFVYTPKDVAKEYDVSFVGGYHPYRAWLVKRLRQHSIDVKVFGVGWRNEKVANYLLSKTSHLLKRTGAGDPAPEDRPLSHDDMIEVIRRSRINLNLPNSTSWDIRYMLSSPMAGINTFRSDKHVDGIKLRFFEIPACGGFQLAYYEDGLEKYFAIGDEIATFRSVDALVETARYYLQHDDERETLARQGHQRVLRDHTIEERFRGLFGALGPELKARGSR